MKIIKLTQHDGSVLFVNTAKIGWFGPTDDYGCSTIIKFVGGSDACVRETPGEVTAIIARSKE